jgi:hypothetical protein
MSMVLPRKKRHPERGGGLLEVPALRAADPRCSRAEIARGVRRKAAVVSGAGRKPILSPCKKCGDLYGARALRAHLPGCTGIASKPRKGKP